MLCSDRWGPTRFISFLFLDPSNTVGKTKDKNKEKQKNQKKGGNKLWKSGARREGDNMEASSGLEGRSTWTVDLFYSWHESDAEDQLFVCSVHDTWYLRTTQSRGRGCIWQVIEYREEGWRVLAEYSRSRTGQKVWSIVELSPCLQPVPDEDVFSAPMWIGFPGKGRWQRRQKAEKPCQAVGQRMMNDAKQAADRADPRLLTGTTNYPHLVIRWRRSAWLTLCIILLPVDSIFTV